MAMSLLALLGAPQSALAAGVDAASEPTGDAMALLLALVALVGVAHLTAHWASSWLQRRYLVLTGVEYVLLGLLLGPSVLPTVHIVDDLTRIAPIVAFAAGWHGLIAGAELDLRTWTESDPRSTRLALVASALAGATVALPLWWFFRSGWLLPPCTPDDALLGAGFLGAAAAAGSPAAVELIGVRYPDARTALTSILERAARQSDILAIAVFGLLYCVVHVGETNLVTTPGTSDWVLLSVGSGLALGVLFALFVGDEDDENTRFLALFGIIVFASGAAYFVQLSALLINLLLGFVLANTRRGAGLFDALRTTARPVRLILLTFAGALWQPIDPLAGVVVVGGALALRLVGLALGGWLASQGTGLRGDLFRGMVPQGEVAIAIALSFRLVYDGPAVDLAYTAIVVSVVVNELIGPWVLRGLLADARELDDERVAVASGGS
ncbi:MAG: hypothetical protein ACI8PZ_002500 [Myxococcota bacterium]|jgi:hypothetical protein